MAAADRDQQEGCNKKDKGPQARLHCRSNHKFNGYYAKLSKQVLWAVKYHKTVMEIILGRRWQ
jgi:trehalose-6-phosphate synthase